MCVFLIAPTNWVSMIFLLWHWMKYQENYRIFLCIQRSKTLMPNSEKFDLQSKTSLLSKLCLNQILTLTIEKGAVKVLHCSALSWCSVHLPHWLCIWLLQGCRSPSRTPLITAPFYAQCLLHRPLVILLSAAGFQENSESPCVPQETFSFPVEVRSLSPSLCCHNT